MRFEVSSLSFTFTGVEEMRLLPEDAGIEIFYEYGGITNWPERLPQMLRLEDGWRRLSIHAPIERADVSSPEADERRIFDALREPFSLYHRFEASHYVVHAAGSVTEGLGEGERADRRALARDRLCRFAEICARDGINMLVENVPNDGHGLFDQAQFARLFLENPQLDCILDTGHALVEGYDIPELQRALGARLRAYHIHDNRGFADEHLRIGEGILDWRTFGRGVREFTPDAVLTLEYANAKLEDYRSDMEALRGLCGEG